MAFGNDSTVNWIRENEKNMDKVRKIHGHDLGFYAYRGHMGDQEGAITTMRFVLTEPNRHGVIKPVKDVDWASGKPIPVTWQIIMPDDPKLAEEFFKFGLEYIKDLRADFKKQEAELKEKASA